MTIFYGEIFYHDKTEIKCMIFASRQPATPC